MHRLVDINLKELVASLNKKPLGVLFLLPDVAESELDQKVKKTWISIQDVLSTNKINIPIYFAFENKENMILFRELESKATDRLNGESEDFFLTRQTPYFEVKAADPQLIDSLELTIMYGVLRSDEEIRSSDKPIILISAPYDYVSIAPSIGNGYNTNSGIMAIMDLSKFFSKILEDTKLKQSAEYDFMFVLTPGSFINYEPSGQFIESLNQRIQDRIKFVLWLDSLAYNNDITVHMGSVNQKDATFAKTLMVEFKKTSMLIGSQFYPFLLLLFITT